MSNSFNPISSKKNSTCSYEHLATIQSKWVVVAMLVANAAALGGIIALGNAGMLTTQSALVIGASVVIGSTFISAIIWAVKANCKPNVEVGKGRVITTKVSAEVQEKGKIKLTPQSSNVTDTKDGSTFNSQSPKAVENPIPAPSFQAGTETQKEEGLNPASQSSDIIDTKDGSTSHLQIPSSSFNANLSPSSSLSSREEEVPETGTYSEEFISTVRSMLKPEDMEEIDKLQKSDTTINFIEAVFINAALNGRIEIVKFLIQSCGANTEVSIHGVINILLINAVVYNNLKMAQLLLSCKANVGADYKGRNALMSAADFGFVQMAQLLIEHGASVDAVDKDGKNALMLAASKGFVQMAQLLVEHGASVDAVDKDGRNALMFAISKGYVQVAHLLIAYNAALDAVDKDGRNALMLAAAEGLVEIAQLLVNKVDINAVDNNEGSTALIKIAELSTVQEEHLQIARILIDGGADVNVIDKYGKTALTYLASSERGYFEIQIAKLLIRNGAKVDFVCRAGKTRLFFGVELLTISRVGQTALLIAASKGYTRMADLLIESGADINFTEQNKRERTPLMLAAENGHLKMVKLLIMKGASINTDPDRKGHTALMCAIYYKNFKIARLLLEKGAEIAPTHKKCKGKNALMIAAKTGDVEMCKPLVSHGAKINAQDEMGKNALMIAAKTGDVEMCKLLVSHGAKINTQDEMGRNALMHALSRISAIETPIVEFLIDQQADVNAANKDGKTPYMYAALRNHIECLELFESNGVDLEAQDNKGRTNKNYKEFVEKKASLYALEHHFPRSSFHKEAIQKLREEIRLFERTVSLILFYESRMEDFLKGN